MPVYARRFGQLIHDVDGDRHTLSQYHWRTDISVLSQLSRAVFNDVAECGCARGVLGSRLDEKSQVVRDRALWGLGRGGADRDTQNEISHVGMGNVIVQVLGERDDTASGNHVCYGQVCDRVSRNMTMEEPMTRPVRQPR